MSDNDEERLKLLVADRTKASLLIIIFFIFLTILQRKYIQLKIVAKKIISALNSGLEEFDNFIKEVDEV